MEGTLNPDGTVTVVFPCPGSWAGPIYVGTGTDDAWQVVPVFIRTDGP